MSDLGLYAQGVRNLDHPILFLDVDGVLNSKDDFLAGYELCQRRVRMLNALPPCDIVISSSWRIGTYPHLVAALRWLGCRHQVIDKTPNSRTYGDVRGHEIKAWLHLNGNPRYAIVDDDGDMLDEQMPFFVQTRFENGLTDETIATLFAILSEAGPRPPEAAKERGKP